MHRVLGLSHTAEHPVRNGEQAATLVAALGDEPVLTLKKLTPKRDPGGVRPLRSARGAPGAGRCRSSGWAAKDCRSPPTVVSDGCERLADCAAHSRSGRPARATLLPQRALAFGSTRQQARARGARLSAVHLDGARLWNLEASSRWPSRSGAVSSRQQERLVCLEQPRSLTIGLTATCMA